LFSSSVLDFDVFLLLSACARLTLLHLLLALLLHRWALVMAFGHEGYEGMGQMLQSVGFGPSITYHTSFNCELKSSGYY
jgi:hypothetical protein